MSYKIPDLNVRATDTPSTVLTAHARARLSERTHMEEPKFCKCLDDQECVIVGIEPYTDKVHKLFYSVEDDATFVAIQDNANGAVITVLPLDYHENLGWSVTPKKMERAKWLAGVPQKRAGRPGVKCEASVVLQDTGATKGVCNHCFDTFPESGEEALTDTRFTEKFLRGLKRRGLNQHNVESAMIWSGEKQQLTKFAWPEKALMTASPSQDLPEQGLDR